MLVMNKRAAEKSKFTLGADVTVAAAAGPVGRSASADTDVKLQAEILTYSRSRGVFAGLALDGATLRPDQESNEEMYSAQLTSEQIVPGETKATTAGAELSADWSKYSTRKEQSSAA